MSSLQANVITLILIIVTELAHRTGFTFGFDVKNKYLAAFSTFGDLLLSIWFVWMAMNATSFYPEMIKVAVFIYLAGCIVSFYTFKLSATAMYKSLLPSIFAPKKHED